MMSVPGGVDGAEPEAAAIGTKVEITFAKAANGQTIPLFTAAGK